MPIEALQLRNDRRIVTLALALLLVPHLWFLRADFALYADDWPRLRGRLLVRAILITIPVAGMALVHMAQTRRAYEDRVLAVAVSLAGAVVVLHALRQEGSVLPLWTPLMILLVLYGALPNRFWRQVLPPLLLSIGLATLRLTGVTGRASIDSAWDLTLIALINAVGILMVSRRHSLEQDLNHAWEAEHAARRTSQQTMAELRILHGIIPICAHCRQVRTDVGDWEQLEAYVRNHTSAQFSHGICPSCAAKHYGINA